MPYFSIIEKSSWSFRISARSDTCSLCWAVTLFRSVYGGPCVTVHTSRISPFSFWDSPDDFLSDLKIHWGCSRRASVFGLWSCPETQSENGTIIVCHTSLRPCVWETFFCHKLGPVVLTGADISVPLCRLATQRECGRLHSGWPLDVLYRPVLCTLAPSLPGLLAQVATPLFICTSER